MPIPSPLDDPVKAAHAWAHYRKLMKLTGAVAAIVVVAVWAYFYVTFGMISVNFYIATGLGIGFTILLGGALMGLAFLSSGTGHDEAVEDPLSDQHDW
ncbi:MAG: hypothetical protein KGL48_00495 [Sphingomonadales bacterium]|nr:hypothetical protein [Sphingomonadales bacterium]MDE2567872.1 hypothetical protein [Sphingomonadales bacterium]